MVSQSFITGSQIYGKPTAQSDIDLVIRISWKEFQIMATTPDGKYGPEDEFATCRHGQLNVIACFSDAAYKLWAEGRARCEEKAPLCKAEAVRIHREIFGESNDL